MFLTQSPYEVPNFHQKLSGKPENVCFSIRLWVRFMRDAAMTFMFDSMIFGCLPPRLYGQKMKSIRSAAKNVIRSDRLRNKQMGGSVIKLSARKKVSGVLPLRATTKTRRAKDRVSAVKPRVVKKVRKRKPSDRLYEVEAITDVKYVASKNRCEYEVLWKPPAGKPNKREQTWEPLENIMSCPFLLLKNEHERHVDWKQASPPGTVQDGQKKPLDPACLPPKFIPHELQMNGSEWVVKVYSEMKYPLDDVEGYGVGDFVSYFLVRLSDGRIDYVQRSYLEYYNPTVLALFLDE